MKILIISLILTACGTESSRTEGNNASKSDNGISEEIAPYPIEKGAVKLSESMETCLMGSPIYCESRFLAPIDCLKANITLILIESEVIYMASQEISMQAGLDVLLRFESAPIIKIGNWKDQSFTQYQCEDIAQ